MLYKIRSAATFLKKLRFFDLGARRAVFRKYHKICEDSRNTCTALKWATGAELSHGVEHGSERGGIANVRCYPGYAAGEDSTKSSVLSTWEPDLQCFTNMRKYMRTHAERLHDWKRLPELGPRTELSTGPNEAGLRTYGALQDTQRAKILQKVQFFSTWEPDLQCFGNISKSVRIQERRSQQSNGLPGLGHRTVLSTGLNEGRWQRYGAIQDTLRGKPS